jgi:hypothetical protein
VGGITDSREHNDKKYMKDDFIDIIMEISNVFLYKNLFITIFQIKNVFSKIGYNCILHSDFGLVAVSTQRLCALKSLRFHGGGK